MMQGTRRPIRDTSLVTHTATYSAVIFLLAVAQCSFFARIEKLPAIPDLILAAVAVVAVIDRWETAILSGIVGGVVIDALGGVGISLSPLFYFVVALVLGALAKKMMQSYLSWVAVMIPALALRAVFTVIQVLLLGNGGGIVQILGQIVLPELICTAVFSLPIYPLILLSTFFIRRRRGAPIR